MGIFDRVTLALFTLVMAVISFLFVVMAAAGWQDPLQWVQDHLYSLNGRWVIGILAGLSLVVSLRFLYFGFRRDKPNQTLIRETDLGEVRISLAAVETLVTKVARGLKGVRDIKATVFGTEGGVGVRIRGVVSPEVNVPDTARLIQQAVTDYTKNVVGVDVTEVKVLVQNITNETRSRRVE
jgi:uncharacterized alkaline shock family protein YloU